MRITRNNIINIYLGHNVILRDTLTLHIRNIIITLGIRLKVLNSHILEPVLQGVVFCSNPRLLWTVRSHLEIREYWDQYPSVLRTIVLVKVPPRNRSHSSDYSNEETLIRGIITMMSTGLRETTRDVTTLRY